MQLAKLHTPGESSMWPDVEGVQRTVAMAEYVLPWDLERRKCSPALAEGGCGARRSSHRMSARVGDRLDISSLPVATPIPPVILPPQSARQNANVNFAGAANYLYRLTLTTGPFVDHAVPMSIPRGQSTRLRLHGWNLPAELIEFPIEPTDGDTFELSHPQLANTLTLPIETNPSLREVEPNELSAVPQELAVPSSITGVISQPGEVDVFQLKLAAKQQILIRTDARAAGSPIDPLLRITKPDGTVIQELDDAAKGNFDPDLSFTASAEGEYRLAITDRFNAGGPRFVYRITALPSRPDFELRVAADSFVLTESDKPLEIPVTIERQRGFASELEITVSGLPEKVTAEPAISTKDGDSAKSVKLLLKAEPGRHVLWPDQIAGRAKSEPPVDKPAVCLLTTFGASTETLWLTVATPAK